MRGQRTTSTIPGPSRTAALALLVASLALAAACGRERSQTPSGRSRATGGPRPTGRPVLVVEDREYSNGDFRAYLDILGQDPKGLGDEALSRLFDRFVDEKIVIEAARLRGISLGEDEKRHYLAKLASEAVSSGEAEPSPPEAPPEGAYDRLLADKYAFLVVRDVQVEDREIADYYEAHKKDFLLKDRVQVSQILVDSEEKAVSVLRQLVRAEEKDFRALARELSLGPEASRGGVMGVFQPGDLPSDMEKVIFALDEGRTSQVVESAYGFHIFRLDKRYPPALQTLEEAAPEIQRRLMSQKMMDALAAHLKNLKETMRWRTLPENLTFDYQRIDE